MNALNELQISLKSLEKKNADELDDILRKHGLNRKKCRSSKLLRKKVSFMLQSEQYGDLSDAMRKAVYDIGLGQPRIKNSQGFMTGTTFTRRWKGEIYRLITVPDGFEMNGQKYKSLSGAAKAVTGTQWSGKVFWKVK